MVAEMFQDDHCKLFKYFFKRYSIYWGRFADVRKQKVPETIFLSGFWKISNPYVGKENHTNYYFQR